MQHALYLAQLGYAPMRSTEYHGPARGITSQTLQSHGVPGHTCTSCLERRTAESLLLLAREWVAPRTMSVAGGGDGHTHSHSTVRGTDTAGQSAVEHTSTVSTASAPYDTDVAHDAVLPHHTVCNTSAAQPCTLQQQMPARGTRVARRKAVVRRSSSVHTTANFLQLLRTRVNPRGVEMIDVANALRGHWRERHSIGDGLVGAAVQALVRETRVMPKMALRKLTALLLPVKAEKRAYMVGNGLLKDVCFVEKAWRVDDCVRLIRSIVETCPERAYIPADFRLRSQMAQHSCH